MSSSSSVRAWIARAKTGDRDAAQKLWERYFKRLVGLARAKLPLGRRKYGEDEAVAISAMKSFLQRAENGRFPNLHSRENLWALLATITVRKAGKVARRKAITEVGESALGAKNDDSQRRNVWEQVLGREPTPVFAAEMAEQCRRLLDLLKSKEREGQELDSVALWMLEGYTKAEIAAKLGCVKGTVNRKLQVIREIWEKEIGS
jgi:DNA-directed RNA polymerase specialized sigma24 family protein